MVRRRLVSQLLWTLVGPAAVASAGCGRLGFDSEPSTADDSSVIDDAPAADSAAGPIADIPTEEDFSSLCGGNLTGSVVIRNTGTEPLVVTGSVDRGFAIVSDLPFVVLPGESRGLEIDPPTAVIGTDRPGTQKVGILTLTTNEAGGHPYTVALVSTVQGAYVTATDAGGMTFPMSFTGSSGMCPDPRALGLNNTGTTPVLVTGPSSAMHFSLGGFTSATVGAGASTVPAVHVVTNGACSGAETITFTMGGPNCSSDSLRLNLSFNISGAASCSCS